MSAHTLWTGFPENGIIQVSPKERKGERNMGYNIRNFINQNDDIHALEQKGAMTSFYYDRDLSVMPHTAAMAYFSAKMGIHKRQLLCQVSPQCGITCQAGAMQWTIGNVEATTGVKGVGDFVGKMFKGAATGESAIKPEYRGQGLLVLEPTYKYIILTDVAEWGGAVTLDDGLFLACESSVQLKVQARSSFSSAVAGGEGLFNTMATGSGVLALECDCPKEELIEIELQNDMVKIDGNMAIAWSSGLQFTTERSGKTLIGSAASGEGLVNVYRGTGKIWMMPVAGPGPSLASVIDS